ncbi:hypothetical protein ANCCAN_15416 [Ancylostoma caninum]|uniref:Glucuronosyltransferase n=1 Tax=Ancylostoma caninum TaxID=29170 RepID=A0A368G5T3_ANCCA|nr:hypothetical protein ANCCAN_15416 [Ancylostoma caninum]
MTTFHLSVLGPTTLLRSMYVIYLLELIVFISTTSSYKFLIYNPFLGHSHVSFMGNIADVLSEGGHDVTVVMPEMDEEQLHRTGVKVTKKIMRTPGDPRARQVRSSEMSCAGFRSARTCSIALRTSV